MKRPEARLFLIAIIISLAITTCHGQKIQVLLTGQIHESVNSLQMWFMSEPLVDFLSVPARDEPRGILGGDEAMRRMIRIYFPRTYEDVRRYDFILLNSPVIYLFTDRQIRWMYDGIRQGSGGINTASVMSHLEIEHSAWTGCILQMAFPNDAPGVVASQWGPGSPLKGFHIVVNRDFPEPVLTPFVPLGIESFYGYGSRYVKAREGASTLCWQVGNFPEEGVPYMIAWDYEKGRTLTMADGFGFVFWGANRQIQNSNPYGLDILMNVIFFSTGREVQTDVLLLHHMRTSFMSFRERMSLLVSLMDFVERCGANPRRLDVLLAGLEQQFNLAGEKYVVQDFEGCQDTMNSGWKALSNAESEAMKLKANALAWIYVVEWSITSSALTFSGFLLWTLMVKRKLYKSAGLTKGLG